MQVSRRELLGGSAMLTMAGLAPLPAAADKPTELTPEQALQALRTGNASFVKGTRLPYRIDDTRRRELAKGQGPFATVVCCSDSRAAPEQVFQVGLGEVFVVRNAGSTVANPQALGSIEYSVVDFDVPLIVVLGHTKCGAAKEAINIVKSNKQFPPTLEAMLLPLLPAALATRDPADDLDTWIAKTARENVRRVAKTLRSCDQPILYPPQRKGDLKVVGAMYDLETGVVDFFDQLPPGPCAGTQH
jgi:carbonic anhydrase